MDSSIEVSVLIPVYATEPEHLGWLREAIDSIHAQDYPVKEIMICDDQSPLPLPPIPDCTVYQLPKHKGVCEARNLLGRQCRTEYLLFLDADDRLAEGALAKMAGRAAPDKAVYGNLMIFGNGHAQRYYSLADYDGWDLLRQPIMPVTSLHTKAAFNQIGGFDPALEGGLEEWDYNIRLMLAQICGEHIHEPLLWYRRHANQRSAGRTWLRGQTKKVLDKYSALEGEGIDMPCCGGQRNPGRGGNPTRNPGHTAEELARGEMVLIEYTGHRLGSITLRGKATGTIYRFGASQRQKYVWPGDAREILRLPGYRAVAKPIEVATAPPPKVQVLEEQAKQSPGKGRPSPAQDLTQIKGVGPSRLVKLGDVGITRFEHLAVADVDTLRSVVKIPRSQAEAVIEEAKRLASG